MSNSKLPNEELSDFFDTDLPIHEEVSPITDTSNHELDIDDSEDYDDDIIFSDEDYCDEDESDYFESIEELFSGEEVNSQNLKMQLVLDAPTIIPQLKIPETIARINISDALKHIELDSFVTLRNDTLYFIDTGKGSLQNTDTLNKTIFHTLLSNSLRHFIESVVNDPDVEGAFVKQYSNYDVQISALVDPALTNQPEPLFLPTIKDIAMDLVTHYITMAISASNNNKSLSTNNIFSQDKVITDIVMEFVDYSSTTLMEAADILNVACAFVSYLTKEKQHLLYSQVNRTTKVYLGAEPKYVTAIINALAVSNPHLSRSRLNEFSAIYSIIEDDSNTRIAARGYSVHASAGSTQRSNLFNMIKLLSTIEKLLKQSKMSYAFLKLFSKYKESVALSLSQNSVEVYFNNLHSTITSSFNQSQMSARPNRRYLAQDMILPKLVGKNVNMLFAVDYSGSITQIELKNQLGVIDSILSTQKAHDATILSFSDDIRTVVDLDSNEELVDALPRFGENIGRQRGTSFQAVIDYLSSDRSNIDLDKLNLLCFVTADAAGGDIIYTDKFLNEFSGKILFLVDEHYKSTYLNEMYISKPIHAAKFEREMLFFQNK